MAEQHTFKRSQARQMQRTLRSFRREREAATRAAALHLADRVRLAGMVSVAVLLTANLLPCTQALAQSTPRIAVDALPTGLTQKTGTPIVYMPAVKNAATGITSAIIKQTDATNIVDWKTFDIGAAARLTIQQPSATSVLLNNVSGGAFQNKTVIDGVLNANGRVYLYNPNGIVFGKTGTVDVNALIASSLKFDESRVTGGLLRQGISPVLAADPSLGFRPGAVVVEGDSAQAAQLKVANGSLLMLAAPDVINAGSLKAPDGQVILAAGGKVYLSTVGTSTSLRGLVVEVSNDYAAGTLAAGATTDTSLAENAASGQIDVARGNATMIGYAVNQKGRVSASTSVNLNGSIFLLARDQAYMPSVSKAPLATRTGELVLGPGSVTEVKAETDSTETISATTSFKPSLVRLHGESIQLQEGASVVAPGGDVRILAEHLYRDSVPQQADPRTDLVRVDFAAGSVVDVSGSQGTTLAMDSNIVTVDLRGTELADNLLLRESPLYGKQVRIDARQGTAVANVSGWLDQRQFGLGQLNTKGGTVSVLSSSSIIQRAGSRISVDGGWVDYQGGNLNTTQLKLGNTLVDIGSAKAGVAYEAAVNLPDSSANYEAGYRQGGSAGSVMFSAPIVVMQGSLSGQVQRGVHQRDVTAANYPLGGQLQIGTLTDAMFSDVLQLGWKLPEEGYTNRFRLDSLIRVGEQQNANLQAPAVGAVFDASDASQSLLARQLDLDTAALSSEGFSRISALTTRNIEVSKAVELEAGGQLKLDARVRGQYPSESAAPAGGSIVIKAPITIPGGAFSAAGVGVSVADGVALNLAGLWTNDQALSLPARDALGNPADPLDTKGGSASLSASVLELGANVKIDVSAGAWLTAQGKSTQGRAGSITLESNPLSVSPIDLAATRQRWGEGLQLLGYGFGSGGSLRVLAREIVMGSPAAGEVNAGALVLGASFFQQGGFTNYDVGANFDLTIAAGASILPRASSWRLDSAVASTPSGAMSSVAAPVLYALSGPAETRAATNLTLRSGQRFRMMGGSKLDMDPAATLKLMSGQQMEIYGGINAPAGRVSLSMDSASSEKMWFGSSASIRADGTAARVYTNGDGISSGELLDGGSIQIGGKADESSGRTVLAATAGAIVMNAGAFFSVGGISTGPLSFKSGGTTSLIDRPASAGGSIEIRSSNSLELLGSFNGASGGGAKAGSLTVALEGDGAVLDVRSLSSLTTRLNEMKSLTASSYVAQRGVGTVVSDRLNAGDFGNLKLRSADAIAFDLQADGKTLSAASSLILDAPTLLADSGVRADITATLFTQVIKELKASDKAAGVSRDDSDLADAAAPIVAARLVDQRLDLKQAATLTLNAPYVQLGNAAADQIAYPLEPIPDEAAPRSALAGNALLKVNAANIDLIGHAALQGFGKAGLTASQDIRLVGVTWVDAVNKDAHNNPISDGTARGSFWMKGSLDLASTQLYPTTLSDFSFVVAGTSAEDSGRLSFSSTGLATDPVYSAGGTITAYAPHIVQAGHVYAPFGQIALGNTDPAVNSIITSDLTYTAGSLTSVAGSGPVPFGFVADGSVPTASRWNAQLPDGTQVVITQNPNKDALTHERALPRKAIISSAGSISTDASAVMDLSGGGTMFAYEFTPGRGGSVDVLAPPTGKAATVFAIIPGFSGKVAPVDGAYGSSGLAVGDAVWLSGQGDLPAGFYTLLPAHYALMPGAYAITATSGTRDMAATANTVLADGSLLVSGRLAQAGTSVLASRTQGFTVSPASVVRRKSEFEIFDASSYFTAKAVAAGVAAPELPKDGGHVVFAATAATSTALVLDGKVSVAAAQGGVAGLADIVAPKIEITSDKGVGALNAVRLSVDQLTNMQARSLSIGAVRQDLGSSTQLNVKTAELTVANDGAHPLTARELLLSAKSSLTLAAGASVRAEGTAPAAADDLMIVGTGALLRASAGAEVEVQRTLGKETSGVLDIARGAVVAASGSAYLDAGGRIGLDGELKLAQGAALTFATPNISLGSYFPQTLIDAGGLRLDGSALAGFGNLASLSFDSYGNSIGLYGTVQLGSAALKQLVFKGAGLLSHGGAASLVADTVQLDGVTPSSAKAPPSNTGSLTVQARSLEIGSGSFSLSGFADAALSASSQIIGVGKAGVLAADQNLNLSAGRFTSAAGSDASFTAGGDLRLAQVVGASAPSAADAQAGLGGQLNFVGSNVISSALITVPSGKIQMAAAKLLDLRAGTVSSAGAAMNFAGTTVYAPGGSVYLQGIDVLLESAATLDVSAVGAAAGNLQINSARLAALDGTLKGGATAGADKLLPTQGGFALSSGNTGDPGTFGALNDKLNKAGFTESRQFNFAQGNVLLTGNETILAHQVSIATDNGNIRIDGNSTINASGAKGGSIELYAAQTQAAGSDGTITIAGNAKLQARATVATTSTAGTEGNGGRVLIATSNRDGKAATSVSGGASIHLDGGSIDVAGSDVDRNGSITLRAPRLADGLDLAVASMGTKRLNSASTVIEGFKVYEAGTITAEADSATNLDATSKGQMFKDANKLGARQSRIIKRLQANDLQLRAGIEVRSLATDIQGDLTVSVNEFASNAADRGWNLDAWRFASQPVNLTLRAKGNLNIVGSISDGFVKPGDARQSMPVWALADGASADLRLVAGADYTAARTSAVLDGQGDVRIDFAARTPYLLEQADPLSPFTLVPIKVAGTNQVVAANPNAPVTNTDAPVALVRTGTGRIDVAAGRDVSLGMAKFYVRAVQDETYETPAIYDKFDSDNYSYNVTLYSASIYTAGKASAANQPSTFTVPKNQLNTHYGATAKTLTAATFASAGGAITVTAGRDVLGAENRGAAVYYRNGDGTAAHEGEPTDPKGDPSTPAVPGTQVALARAGSQLVNNWLFRQGRSSLDADGNVVFETLADKTTTLNTAWWTRSDYFDQGIAALGGGDVSVSAGRNVSDLSVSVASNAYVPKAGAALSERGGGDLSVRAGGDIQGGAFYAQKGAALLRADGSVSGSAFESTASSGPLIALGDAQLSVMAGRGIELESVYNPTMTEQSVFNQSYAGAIPLYGSGFDPSNMGEAAVKLRSNAAQLSNFLTYGADSAVRFTALGGDVHLSANAENIAYSGGWEIPNNYQKVDSGAGLQLFYGLLPPTLVAASLGGNVVTDNGVALSPAASGQLELLARDSIRLSGAADFPMRMLDNDPLLMSTALAPRVMTQTEVDVIKGISTALEAHSSSGLHAHDAQPALLVALNGDVLGNPDAKISLSVPKQTQVIAGRDIVDLGLRLQHNSANDVSLLQAGRDVVYTTQAIGSAGSPSTVAVLLGGAGRLEVMAGRNVDLGNSFGIVTRGNLDNVYLPEGGASVRVVAGGAKAPDYSAYVAFASSYGSAKLATDAELLALAIALGKAISLDVDQQTAQKLDYAFFKSLPKAEQNRFYGLVARTEKLFNTGTEPPAFERWPAAVLTQLSAFIDSLGARLNPEQAWAELRALDAKKQSEFLATQPELVQRLAQRSAALQQTLAAGNTEALDASFFAGLVETGKAGEKTADGKVIEGSLKSFDALIASMFPDAAASAGGDISNFGSQIKTEQGGAVTLYAPAGSTYAGLTLGYPVKLPSNQGIFTVRGGAVNALVEKDFLVNQGRVFTLGGGDITLVSQRADIDAGKGSKTAASAPPPLITVDPNGSIAVDVSGSISGSGIATLKTRADTAAGDVYAIAPRGVFDAGDAGVRSSGSVLVVAPIVLNGDNISAGGTVVGSGVTVAAPSVGTVAAPTNATPKDDELSKAAANPGSAERSLPLTVDALGYGPNGEAGADSAPDAKPDASDPESEDEKKKKKKK